LRLGKRAGPIASGYALALRGWTVKAACDQFRFSTVINSDRIESSIRNNLAAAFPASLGIHFS
jgi:hypothetical protein